MIPRKPHNNSVQAFGGTATFFRLYFIIDLLSVPAQNRK
jgi:hypothetical protein